MCGTQPTATSTSGTFDTRFDATTTSAMNATSPSDVAARDDRRDRIEHVDERRRCARRRRRRRTARRRTRAASSRRPRTRAAAPARAGPCSAAAATIAAPASDTPASASPANSASAARPLAIASARSTAGRGGACARRAGRLGSSRRNIHAITTAFAARHTAPTGSVSTRYCANPIASCAAAPTIMFCGLPLKLTTPPTFARRGEREQVRQRRQPRLDDDRDDQRREHHAHRVVDEQRGQRARRRTPARTAASAPSARGSARGTRRAGRTAPRARYAAITSTPNSRTSTCRSIAASAASIGRPPTTTIATAPTIAPAGPIEPEEVQLAARDHQVGDAEDDERAGHEPRRYACDTLARRRSRRSARAIDRGPQPRVATWMSNRRWLVTVSLAGHLAIRLRSVRRRRLAARSARLATCRRSDAARVARADGPGVGQPAAGGRGAASSAKQHQADRRSTATESATPDRSSRRRDAAVDTTSAETPARRDGSGTGPGSGSGIGGLRRRRRVPARATSSERPAGGRRRSSRPPPLIPPTALKALRISGETQIHPPDTEQDAMLRDGRSHGRPRRSRSASTAPAQVFVGHDRRLDRLRRLRRAPDRRRSGAGAIARTWSVGHADAGMQRRDLHLLDRVARTFGVAWPSAIDVTDLRKTYRTPFRRKQGRSAARRDVRGRARPHLRLRRPQRRRQDDDDPHADGPDPADRRHARRSSATRSRAAPRASASASCPSRRTSTTTSRSASCSISPAGCSASPRAVRKQARRRS